MSIATGVDDRGKSQGLVSKLSLVVPDDKLSNRFDSLATDPDLKKAGIDIKEFVKDLTKRIRRDLAIDWTNNETIKARIRQNVRLLLIQKGVTELLQTERLIESIYQETVKVYREYLPA